jgi:hypothetical protein
MLHITSYAFMVVVQYGPIRVSARRQYKQCEDWALTHAVPLQEGACMRMIACSVHHYVFSHEFWLLLTMDTSILGPNRRHVPHKDWALLHTVHYQASLCIRACDALCVVGCSLWQLFDGIYCSRVPNRQEVWGPTVSLTSRASFLYMFTARHNPEQDILQAFIPVREAHSRVSPVHHFHIMVEEPCEIFGALSIQHCLAEQSCPVRVAKQ